MTKRLVTLLRDWARRLKLHVLVLWLAARDHRTPLVAKIVAASVAAYALSPIDLIPDFIPVLGLLDDLLIVPLGIMLAIRLIPAPLLVELRAAAASRSRPPASKAGLAFVITVWVAACLAFGWVAYRVFVLR